MKLIALLVGAIIISSVSACYFVEASSLEEKISSFLPNSFLTLFYLLFPKIFDKLKGNIENNLKEENETGNNSSEGAIEQNENISDETTEEIINESGEIENNSTDENISNETTQEVNENQVEENITSEINSQNENNSTEVSEEITENQDEVIENISNEAENNFENSTQDENITNEEVNDENNEIENNSTDKNISQISEEITENQDEVIENNSTGGAIEQNENISNEADEEINNESSEIENNSTEANEENLLEWAFLVYISGDNDLYEYAINELNELLSINSYGIAILFDGALNNDSKLYILNNSITTIEKNELNMGSNSTLEEFILYAQEILRAKNYAIEFWGHGNGWAGTCLDKSSSDLLEIDEIKRALENKNISIIIFSSCNMGCIEVAYALRNCSKYMLASPCAMLATGLPHERIFARGFGNVEEVCWAIYEEYMSYYSYASPKFAIWNLSMFDEFIGQFSLFIDHIKNLSFWNARNESAINSQYIDLYSFANKINFSLPQIFYGNASIYFPLPLYYSKYYSNTDFAKDTLWDEFLKSLK